MSMSIVVDRIPTRVTLTGVSALVEVLPFRSNIWMKSIDLPAEGIILNIRIAGSRKIDRAYRSAGSNSVATTIDRDTPDRWGLSQAAPRIWYFE